MKYEELSDAGKEELTQIMNDYEFCLEGSQTADDRRSERQLRDERIEKLLKKERNRINKPQQRHRA